MKTRSSWTTAFIYIASALVVLVIFVFLRTVRASIIPIVTIPVSLIGTFSLMALAGSYGPLYEGDSRALLFGDLAKMMARLPLTLGRDYFANEFRNLQDRFARRERPAAAVPVPMMKPLPQRSGPPPGVLPASI